MSNKCKLLKKHSCWSTTKINHSPLKRKPSHLVIPFIPAYCRSFVTIKAFVVEDGNAEGATRGHCKRTGSQLLHTRAGIIIYIFNRAPLQQKTVHKFRFEGKSRLMSQKLSLFRHGMKKYVKIIIYVS